MAHTETHGGQTGGPIRHETTDANLGSVERLLVALGVFLAIAFAFVYFLYGQLKEREVRLDTAPPALASRTGDRQPPSPRLQTTPSADLTRFRLAEDEALNGYGWVDRTHGVARVPVARAIELIAEKGLPARPAAPQAAPGAPGTAAPAPGAPAAPPAPGAPSGQ